MDVANNCVTYDPKLDLLNIFLDSFSRPAGFVLTSQTEPKLLIFVFFFINNN